MTRSVEMPEKNAAPAALPPWLQPLAERFVSAWRAKRAPQALLLAGPGGVGKGMLAQWLVQRWTCESAAEEHLAPCGVCASCRWFAAGTHPDVLTLTAQSSDAIPIDAVRKVQEQLQVSAHRRRRAVLIEPAEAMNRYTANALLKVLEEPPPETLFVLVSHLPGRLLPTVISRTQRWQVTLPLPAAALAWLQTQAQRPDWSVWLGLAGGAPLAALAMAEAGWETWRRQFLTDVAERAWRQPVRVAREWSERIKSKPAQERRFDFAAFHAWWLAWLHDVALAASGVQTAQWRFPDAEAQRHAVARRRPLRDWLRLWQEMLTLSPWVRHPLNVAMQCDALWQRYVASPFPPSMAKGAKL